MFPAKHLSITIHRSPDEIYQFTSDPQNLKLWASGLSEANLQKSGEEWLTDSPMGKIRLKFAPKNSFGVMDHDVTLPSGEVNQNPFRVVPNGKGGEVIFTLYRLPKMNDQEFTQDEATILKDLKKLKQLLEGFQSLEA